MSRFASLFFTVLGIVTPLGVFPVSVLGEEWQYPIAVAVGADETVYVADRQLPGLWTLKDGRCSLFVRASRRFRTPLNAARCVHRDKDGAVYVGDSATRDVWKVEADGALTQLTAPHPLSPRTKLTDDVSFTADNFGLIGIPMAIASNSQGDLFVADAESQRIWRIPAGSRTPEEFLVVSGPRGVAVDTDENVWILSLRTPQLQRVGPDGVATVLISSPTFEFPHQIAVRDDGTAVVSDGYARAIWKVGPGGRAEQWISGAPLENPVGIALRGDDLLIADPGAKALFSAALDGTLIRIHPAAE